MRNPEIIPAIYAAITGVVFAVVMLIPDGKPLRQRLGLAVAGLLLGWAALPLIVLVLLTSTPQDGTWDNDHVLRLRARDESAGGLLLFPGLAVIAIGVYLAGYAVDKWERAELMVSLAMIAGGLAALGAGAGIIWAGFRMKRIPADAILLDFDQRMLRRKNGAKDLGASAFDRLGGLHAVKAECRLQSYDQHRQSRTKVPEWQVFAQGMPGVCLYAAGSPERAEKTMQLIQSHVSETLQGRRPRRVPLFGVGVHAVEPRS